MKDHPDFARFLTAITRTHSKTIAFKGVAYRACSPEYANSRDLLSGEGARKSGGRWNAPTSFPVVYLAQRIEGAIAETLGVAGRYGFDPAARLPMTLVAIDATLERVLDLTDATVRRALGVTIAQMNGCPWRAENAAANEALTQAIGRAAQEAGLEGILVASSVKRRLRNINVFPKNVSSAGALRIRSAEKSPPPPAPGVI
ncbi:MAG TPA: RES family NAD+ phosphorylase [Phycisphaerae bacterium]|nr:RES family NAD+ phosphorylase [Phycisphaerae bacterium]